MDFIEFLLTQESTAEAVHRVSILFHRLYSACPNTPKLWYCGFILAVLVKFLTDIHLFYMCQDSLPFLLIPLRQCYNQQFRFRMQLSPFFRSLSSIWSALFLSIVYINLHLIFVPSFQHPLSYNYSIISIDILDKYILTQVYRMIFYLS